MGVGLFWPIEGHILAEGEGQCSTQVEPSPAEHPQDIDQRQAALPQPQDHPTGLFWPIEGLDTGVSGDDEGLDEDPSEFRGYGPLDDQGNPTGQGEDQNSNHEDVQVASQESPLEAHTRREKKLESIFRRRSISLENVLGSVRKGVSTRR
jgi:hypothetical protein